MYYVSLVTILLGIEHVYSSLSHLHTQLSRIAWHQAIKINYVAYNITISHPIAFIHVLRLYFPFVVSLFVVLPSFVSL